MFRRSPAPLRLLLGLTAATALAVSLAACAPGGDSGATASDADTLITVGGQGDMQINFNPFSPSSIGGVGTIYEPLFFINKVGDAEPEPLLGVDQSWNEDGTVYTVTVRDDVTWSDGEPFTAADVAFTFSMLKDNPSINNIGFDGEVAADGDSVAFTFDSPSYVKGPDILNTVIVPEHLWADVSPTEFLDEQPVGTGAFELADFKPQAFTLAANPDYWGGEPELKAIRYISLSGNQAQADALAAGTIDWQTSPVPDIQNVPDRYPGYVNVTANQNQTVLASCASAEMGCSGPQTDPAVRQALSLAINRDQVNALAFQNTSTDISPTFVLLANQEQWISPSVVDPVVPTTPQADQARALLEGAGWALGGDGIYAKDGERLSLGVEVVTGWTDYITTIDTIAAQAREAGIEVVPVQSSWNEWTDKKQRGNFELAIDSLAQGPAPDPYYVYNNFFATTVPVGESSGNNFSRYADPDVSAAVEALQALAFDDTAAREPLMATIQDRIVADLPYIPVLTAGTSSQWNVAKFDGWPTDDDLYAFPAVWSRLDSAEVFKKLSPTGE
ncbi:ABC transporter substrate-binding protein [Microbacterium radiodurans]|uniref:ABC transporter substrate-binding protein n=2 Tax=Microbacterium radiodurans TaxID=661398 RepID=A0A5J5IWF3_9MICO|nr:ABC transporter substrate-binding protein [Microbacterium radiodurans]